MSTSLSAGLLGGAKPFTHNAEVPGGWGVEVEGSEKETYWTDFTPGVVIGLRASSQINTGPKLQPVGRNSPQFSPDLRLRPHFSSVMTESVELSQNAPARPENTDSCCSHALMIHYSMLHRIINSAVKYELSPKCCSASMLLLGGGSDRWDIRLCCEWLYALHFVWFTIHFTIMSVSGAAIRWILICSAVISQTEFHVSHAQVLSNTAF